MTFSVLARDSATGTTGGAVASCVPLDTLRRVYGAVPDHGALITQSYLHDTAHGQALALLEQGASAEEVVTALTDPAFDPSASLRQYAVIDGLGESASFTGPDAEPHAGHRAGQTGRFVFLVQGNFTSGPAVLDRTATAFAANERCDLADALVRGLLAGGAEGHGDARCLPHGAPAQSALLVVGSPDAPVLEIAVDGTDPPSEDPLAVLAETYAVWRADQPCPEPAPAVSGSGCAIAATHGSESALAVALVLSALAARRFRRRISAASDTAGSARRLRHR